ncbi:DNA methylase N-4 [Acidobacteria bacterium AB60]|nr:DNA methylase N-4 [Acidobacteria bacterium AB60]
MTYEDFLRAKVLTMPDMGIEIEDGEIHPILKLHQRAIVRWAVRRGRAAIFSAFGLGKTVCQLEILRLLIKHLGGDGLIVAPLGVRLEFMRDAEMLGIRLSFIRSNDEVRRPLDLCAEDPCAMCAGEYCAQHGAVPCGCDLTDRHYVEPRPDLYITNYESVREGKLDPREFEACSLDEAACLRGFGGTKTFRQMMAYFEGSGKYRFVATATPSPNDFIELLSYSAFLDIMDVSAAKTKFFKRNSEHADELTLMPSREQDFWLWCSSWAVFLQSPADLGFDATGYEMPEMRVHWHEVPSDHENAGMDPSGQGRLLRNSAIGLSSAAREKRDSLPRRLETLGELIDATTEDLYGHEQFIVWCDLNDEQNGVDKLLGSRGISFSSLYGNQDIDEREDLMNAWRGRETTAFVSKPIMYGAGVNLQQCAHAIFLGVGYKFFDFIQAIHRIHRFLQKRPVRIDIIYTEAEREIRRSLEEKWENHKLLVANMTELIRKFGLGSNAMQSEAVRKMEVSRREARGENFFIVNNDCVPETGSMPENSVDLVLTSIPFSTQYEYSPSFRDFGHTESNDHFWAQMDYLIPNLFRILRPGRVAAIHVKDRITPSGLTGMGFQTVYPFSDDCVAAFKRHGFGFLARKTIVTDVVRENNQTYRLGWTEQCKDGSRMGAGLPEYLLIFRKPPTDTSNGYADLPVVKDKAQYTRSRWQIDAHGFMRSNGDRLLEPSDFHGVPHERIFKLFRQDSMRSVYDFERHVHLSESLETCQECGHIHVGDRKCGQCPCKIAGSRLPATFMLLQPQSWHKDVWTDVARMRTLNALQVQGNREMHVCPLQFDIVDRAITQYSMPGEIVFDPFAGIGTVPMRAIELGRKGWGCELSEVYFADAVMYAKEAERKAAVPTLFDLLEEEATA